MKNLALIFGIVFISLIGVNAQNLDTQNNERETFDYSTELYDSITKDYEDLYKAQTEQETIEDEEMELIFNDIFENFEITEQINKEIKEDQNNNRLYIALLNDMENK